MKQPAFNGLAVSKSLYDSGQGVTTDQNVSSKPSESKNEQEFAKALAKFLQLDYTSGRKYPGPYGAYERNKDAIQARKDLTAEQLEELRKEAAQRCKI